MKRFIAITSDFPKGSAWAARAGRGVLVMIASAMAAACAAPPATVEPHFLASAVADLPDGTPALVGLADDFAKQGRFGASIPLYRRAHDQDSRAVPPLLGLAKALVAVGRYDEAAEVYRSALKRQADNPEALRGLGGVMIVSGNAPLAMALFGDVLATNPTDARAISGRAVALDMLDRHEEARAAFRQALAVAPEDGEIANNYGLSLALAGEYDEAVPMLEELALREQSAARQRQNLALAYGLAGRERAARRIAAIDLDLRSVESNMAFYATLRGMAPADRRRAVLGGIRNPAHDLRQAANRALSEPPDAGQTVGRIIAAEKPAPVPEPEPAPEPEPEPEAVALEVDIPPLVDPTGYAVQIAAYRRAGELMPGWKILSAKYADLISDLEPRRSEKDFGPRDKEPSGFFYRLNAGPLKSYRRAAGICKEIRARGGDCWVRPPEPSEGRTPEAAERPENEKQG